MHTSGARLTVFLLALATSFPKVYSLPTPANSNANNTNLNATGNANDTAAAAGAACEAGVDLLATGIQQNINDQLGENGSVTAIAGFLAGGTVDQAQFLTAKAQLLSFVLSGIAVRQNNQAIAPANNAAIAGLAIVAGAQQQELALTSQLVGDPAQDNDVVKQLLSDFAGGIQQNQQNLANATAGCTPSNAQAASTLKSAMGAGANA